MIDGNCLTWVRDKDFLKGFYREPLQHLYVIVNICNFLTFPNENKTKKRKLRRSNSRVPSTKNILVLMKLPPYVNSVCCREMFLLFKHGFENFLINFFTA